MNRGFRTPAFACRKDVLKRPGREAAPAPTLQLQGVQPKGGSDLGQPVEVVQHKKNGPTRGPSFLVMVEVARIELASGSVPQSGLHA
jgi:hypothetical protein